MKSYHNDLKLKNRIVKEMKLHQKNDQFIKGTYGKENGIWKGCAVGCAIHSMNKVLKRNYRTDQHEIFEEAIGVPEWLARLSDTIFEELPDGENSQFAVDFLQAIPVGVDLNSVKWQFCAFILSENIERVLALKDISDELKNKVVDSIRGALKVHEEAVRTGVWDESAARSAESAAWSARSAASAESAASAAWSAAWGATRSAESAARSAASAESAASAAWSAARSAAWSATRSAAWSAAYRGYAKQLLVLLKAGMKNEGKKG